MTNDRDCRCKALLNYDDRPLSPRGVDLHGRFAQRADQDQPSRLHGALLIRRKDQIFLIALARDPRAAFQTADMHPALRRVELPKILGAQREAERRFPDWQPRGEQSLPSG